MAIDDLMSQGGRLRRPEGPRRSGARAVIFWIIALGAGTAAAMMLKFYLERSAAPTPAPLARLVVAAIDLPIATTLRPEHVREVDWPENAQPQGSVRDRKEILGRVVVAKMVQGEPILVSKLANKDAGRGMPALIPENMRAVAVRVDDVVGVAGFIHPEDRVDVVVTMKVKRPGSSTGEELSVSKIFLQNIKVLAVGKQIETEEGTRNKPVPATVATLLVTPGESEKLALAATAGKLLLTLRSWSDASSGDTPGAVAANLLIGASSFRDRTPSDGDDARRRSTSRDKDPTPPPAVVATPQDVVEILRGDRFEKREFDAKEKRQ